MLCWRFPALYNIVNHLLFYDPVKICTPDRVASEWQETDRRLSHWLSDTFPAGPPRSWAHRPPRQRWGVDDHSAHLSSKVQEASRQRGWLSTCCVPVWTHSACTGLQTRRQSTDTERNHRHYLLLKCCRQGVLIYGTQFMVEFSGKIQSVTWLTIGLQQICPLSSSKMSNKSSKLGNPRWPQHTGWSELIHNGISFLFTLFDIN